MITLTEGPWRMNTQEKMILIVLSSLLVEGSLSTLKSDDIVRSSDDHLSEERYISTPKNTDLIRSNTSSSKDDWQKTYNQRFNFNPSPPPSTPGSSGTSRSNTGSTAPSTSSVASVGDPSVTTSGETAASTLENDAIDCLTSGHCPS